MAKKFSQADIFQQGYEKQEDGSYKRPIGKIKTVRAKSTKKEEKIQVQVCNYIKYNYPDVIFASDASSGLKLPIWLAALFKKMKSSAGLPDMMIFEPIGNISHGLCLELKRDESSPFLKSGKLSSNDHIREQAEILLRLKSKGYQALFAVGYVHACKIIDDHMNGVLTEQELIF